MINTKIAKMRNAITASISQNSLSSSLITNIASSSYSTNALSASYTTGAYFIPSDVTTSFAFPRINTIGANLTGSTGGMISPFPGPHGWQLVRFNNHLILLTRKTTCQFNTHLESFRCKPFSLNLYTIYFL